MDEKPIKFELRLATPADRPALERLIRESVRGLARGFYDERQIELSIRSVFGVDDDLIADGTYFVVEAPDGRIAGAGGWSRLRTLYGASGFAHGREPGRLDPATDDAKIRAFFVAPDFARRGVGTLILDRCEREARAGGFRGAEMMATLPGVPLYAARGYETGEEHRIPVGDDGEFIVCVKMRKDLT